MGQTLRESLQGPLTMGRLKKLGNENSLAKLDERLSPAKYLWIWTPQVTLDLGPSLRDFGCVWTHGNVNSASHNDRCGRAVVFHWRWPDEMTSACGVSYEESKSAHILDLTIGDGVGMWIQSRHAKSASDY
ncbi:hypothetical protein CR513_41301, partial [Mucuna pruriens]